MAIDDKVRDEKAQYNINRVTEKQQKYQHYHQVKLLNMNSLQVKRYCHLIKVE